MIRSMTGFARCEEALPQGQIACELKSVNHRFLEMSLRLPEDLKPAEAQIRQAVSNSVRRGKVEVSLQYRPTVSSMKLELDSDVLASVLQAARTVTDQAGGKTRMDPMDVLRWPGVVRETARNEDDVVSGALAVLSRTLGDLAKFRDSEGARLRTVLEERAAGLSALADRVEARLPEVRERLRSKMHERIAQWAGDVNQERLEQELATVAQRLDVDEEIERLRGHLVEVRKTLDAPDAAGRRLDFLMQELNREANTLSSKSQDLETHARRRGYEGADRADAGAGAKHRMTYFDV